MSTGSSSLLDSKVIWKRNRLLYPRAMWSLVQQLTTPFLLQNHKHATESESLRSLGHRQTQILKADTAIIHLQREDAHLQTRYRVMPFPFISTPFCTQTKIVSERLGEWVNRYDVGSNPHMEETRCSCTFSCNSSTGGSRVDRNRRISGACWLPA